MTFIIWGDIIEYNGNFYTDEIPGKSGFDWSDKDEEGMITTYVSLFFTEYIPEKSKPLSEYPIQIVIWGTQTDEKGPLERYAFGEDQLAKAKALTANHDKIDIFINGKEIAKEEFLKNEFSM